MTGSRVGSYKFMQHCGALPLPLASLNLKIKKTRTFEAIHSYSAIKTARAGIPPSSSYCMPELKKKKHDRSPLLDDVHSNELIKLSTTTAALVESTGVHAGGEGGGGL